MWVVDEISIIMNESRGSLKNKVQRCIYTSDFAYRFARAITGIKLLKTHLKSLLKLPAFSAASDRLNTTKRTQIKSDV